MSVQFIIDDFGLTQEESLMLTDIAEIPQLRQQVRDNLEHTPEKMLSICMSSSLFQRFRDFKGARGISVKQINVVGHLREQLGETPPLWLSNRLISDLGLYHRPALTNELKSLDNIAGKVLALLHPALAVPDDIQAFYSALQSQPPVFRELLKLEAVDAYLRVVLQKFMPGDTSTIFIENLRECQDIPRLLEELVVEKIREKLRLAIDKHSIILDSPLPPRYFDTQFVRHLPVFSLPEDRAKNLPEQIRRMLELVERRIRMGECTADTLADLVFIAWPSVLDLLEQLFQDNAEIASGALQNALQSLQDDRANQLAIRIQEYLQFSPCEPLSTSATLEDALDWGKRYFDYALREFMHYREPQDEISRSFSRWILDQQPRIMRSNADWRRVSKQVEYYLSEDYLVILCMVDALGAIHIDMLNTVLYERLNDTHIETEMLFAPLPTLTEVGKPAVLTGISDSPANYEAALRQRYAQWLDTPETLKIVKSWQESAEHLHPATRLLVYFENRVDENLHGCLSFSKHREEIQPILSQLARSVKDWLKDAIHSRKKAVVLITSDHGVSSISTPQTVTGINGKVNERTIKINEAEKHKLAPNLTFLPTKNSSGYAVPLNRVRFEGRTPLTHGGLTPEEVLIPFVIISYHSEKNSQVVEVRPAQQHCQSIEGGWYVKLAVIPSVRLEKLKILTKHPFKGETQILIDLYPQRHQEILLEISSEYEQSGMVEIRLEARYQLYHVQQWHTSEILLHLNLGAHLLIRNSAAKEFEHMFEG